MQPFVSSVALECYMDGEVRPGPVGDGLDIINGWWWRWLLEIDMEIVAVNHAQSGYVRPKWLHGAIVLKCKKAGNMSHLIVVERCEPLLSNMDQKRCGAPVNADCGGGVHYYAIQPRIIKIAMKKYINLDEIIVAGPSCNGRGETVR